MMTPNKTLQKSTVLIVDDLPANIQLIASLIKEDYHIQIATNGTKALSIAAGEKPPDLILLDIMMPEMDGYEVCRRLKSDDLTCNIPVIFITAMDAAEDEEKGLSLGAVDYISKPFKPGIVRARVRSHTERKRAIDTLRESEEKFISIFEESPDPIVIIGSEMEIIEVNLGFEKTFGLNRKEVEGTRLENTPLIHLVSRINNEDLTGHAKEAVLRDEMRFVHKSGTPFIADVSISRIFIQNKLCLLIQIHDIDEIRRAHNAVTQLNNKLKILSSITRHDILNRIMVTSAYCEMLQAEASDPIQIKRLEAIRQSSVDIQSLIEFTGQYQDLGAVSPEWQKIDRIIQIPEIVGILKGVTISSTLGDIQILADMMLSKVMYNLVENSVRHGQQVSHIRLSCHEEGSDMIFWYEDDGGGIPQDQKENVFKKGVGKNTGLGLFLIREILSITGISIIENGEPGIGVRFEIRVPSGKFSKQILSQPVHL